MRSQFLSRMLASAVCVLSLSGCFEFEQTIKLKKNLSGTASMDLKMDLEPMVYMMAFMKKAMMGGGENAQVTKSELAEARTEFLENRVEEMKAKLGSKEELVKKLPAGVKLKKYRSNNKGTTLSMNAMLGFDHVKKLSELAKDRSSADSALSSFTIEETATTLTMRTVLEDPSKAAGAPNQGGPEDMPGEAGKVMRQAMDKLKANITIEAPFKVLEHNATQVKGKKLIWNMDYAAFKAMRDSGEPMNVKVVFQK